jgi:hypothetical protein
MIEVQFIHFENKINFLLKLNIIIDHESLKL